MINESTHTDRTSEELTFESLKRIALHHYKTPALPAGRKIGFFEKLMNKLGWYRQTEVFILNPKSFYFDWSDL